MAELRWTPRESVGIPELDADHREMYALTQYLVSALQTGAPQAEVQAVVDDLLEATLAHFEHEERLLEEAAYPEAEAHRHSHDRLLRTILHFRADVRHRRYDPAVAATFIHAWVSDHVHNEDTRYTGHLLAAAARGASAV